MVDLMVSEQQSGTAGKGVPVGWVQCKLGDVLTLQRGFDLPQRLRKEGNIPIISSSGESGWHNKAIVSPPGIVTGRYGTIGEVFFIDRPFWPLNTTLYVREFNGITPFYAYFLLKTVDFQSHSGKSGVPGVNRNDVHQENILLPPIKEQIAITTTLSNVDELISALERLLSKKQAIKTATMQQLLTGKTRLPQFVLWEDGTVKGYKKSELGEIPEDWGVNNIGDLFSITAGGDLRQSEFSDIQSEKHLYPIYSNAISDYGLYGYCQSYDYVGNYLTITARGGIGHAVARKGSFCAIGRLLVLSPKGDSNVKFYEGYINQYLSFANESTGVPQLTAPQVAKYPVVYPYIEEQTAIAAILSDMDKDIQTLQQRLDKTRQLKQGMMQELLTGKTRLI